MDSFVEFGHRSDTFNVEIRPTTKCNYNCYYCTSNRNNANDIIKLNTDNICSIIEVARKHSGKKIYVYVVGGEPTVYTHLLEFVNEISNSLQSGDYIEIQTNLSKSKKWLDNFVSNLTSPGFVFISASYHNTQCKDVSSFIDKCLFLKSENMLGTVTVMYNKNKNVMNVYEMMARLIGDCVSLSFLVEPTLSKLCLPSRNNMDSSVTCEVEYIKQQEDLERLKTVSPYYFEDQLSYKTKTTSGKMSRYSLWLNKLNDFSGHECYLGMDMLFINWNGDCYTCPNDQWSDVKPIMNIQQNDFSCTSHFLNINYRICPYSWCCPHGVAEYKKGPKRKNITDTTPCKE